MRFAVLLSLFCLGGCDLSSPLPLSAGAKKANESTSSVSSSQAPNLPKQGDSATNSKNAECSKLRSEISSKPALSGAPGFEARRGEILGRAKGENILFLRPPKRNEPTDLQSQILEKQLHQGSPYVSIPNVLGAVKYFPEKARALLIPEGYVYGESPEEATVLVDVLRLGRLFNEKEIFLLRGSETFALERDNKLGIFRFKDGPDQNEEAHLLLGDRVAITKEELASPIHRNLQPIVDSDCPDQLKIEHLAEGWANVKYRFGSDWVDAVIKEHGTDYKTECTILEGESGERASVIRERNLQRHTAMNAVRNAIRVMIREKLMFDEPLKEVGQQDGSLRPLWRWSYDHGGSGFGFNGVGYAVFDAKGRAFPPQVCIDFVLDSYERGSGTWFGGSGENRGRVKGGVDFEALEPFNRRSAAEFVKFADAHPEMFVVWSLPDEDRIPYAKRKQFFESIQYHRDQFREGDAIVIHGYKADGQVHYHSFLVDSVDPISGVPFRLAGNAGRPRLQTFEGIMRSAPARSIKHVVSPRTDWLVQVMPKPKE